MYKSILATLLILLCSFSFSSTSDTDDQVMKIADSQMGTYLAKIEPGKEADFGFTEKDDFDLCVVGKPYRIMQFTRSFYDNPLEENTSYIDIKNKWLVPVSVNHQYKVFLTVEGNPGNLHVSAMGSVPLAKEIQLISMGVNDSDEFYILKVPKLSADFFVHEANNSFEESRFIPLESAITAIPALNSKKEDYSLAEVQHLVKDAADKQK